MKQNEEVRVEPSVEGLIALIEQYGVHQCNVGYYAAPREDSRVRWASENERAQRAKVAEDLDAIRDYATRLADRASRPAPSGEAVSQAALVTEFNVGRWCLSEDECIAGGINFAAYERGVLDAAKAFGQNVTAPSQKPAAWMAKVDLAVLHKIGGVFIGAKTRDDDVPLFLCSRIASPSSPTVKTVSHLSEEAMSEIAKDIGDEDRHTFMFNKSGTFSVHAFGRQIVREFCELNALPQPPEALNKDSHTEGGE